MSRVRRAVRVLRDLGPGGWLSASWLAIVGVAAIAAPWLPFRRTQDLRNIRAAPSWSHPLGTDSRGVDMIVRVLDGARVSLLVGILAGLLGLVVGAPIGLFAGYLRGRFDRVTVVGLDVFAAFPGIVAASAGSLVWGQSLRSLILVLGLLTAPVFARVTRAAVLPLAERDFALMANIPYLWLSITIETDNQDYLLKFKGGPPIAKRLAMARKAVALGINVQITISPCLPYTNAHDFTQTLLDTGAQRFVVDTFKSGDGSHGSRSARSAYAKLAPDWEDEESASLLYEQLISAGANVGWSSEGFCGIPYRNELAAHAAAERQEQTAQTAMFAMDMSHPVELIATEQIVLHFGVPGAPKKRLRGFSYLWIKYITGFDARYHCATSLKGKYHWELGVPIFAPSSHILDTHPYQYIYLCGVAETRWADNLHIPMHHAPGETITDTTYTGVPIIIQNARRLDIPWVDDGWNDFPRSYTTCRNWQFGIAYYGYDGQARPAQADFTRPNRDRSQEALERAKRPPIKKGPPKQRRKKGHE